MRNVALAIPFLVLATSLLLPAEETNQGIDKAVLEVCNRRESNREDTTKLAGGDTGPECAKQISTSVEACLKDPGITQADYRGTFSQVDVATDLSTTIQRQVAAYESGKQKFAAARAICEKEDDNVLQVCKREYQSLKSSLAESRGTAGVNPAAQKTQLQMAATVKARDSAMKTIEDQALCLKYEGDIYDEAIAKTRAAVPMTVAQGSNDVGTGLVEKASVSDGATAGAAPTPAAATSPTPGSASPTGAGPAATAGAPPTTWSSLAGQAESAGSKAVGMVGTRGASAVNVATAVNDRDGWQFTTSAASLGATVSDSRLLGYVGGLPGAAVAAILNPDPTSKCAGDFSDPVQAKAAGCEVNVHVSSASYDTAIKTLRHD